MQATGRRIIAPFVVSLSTEAGNAQPRRQAALTGLGCDSKNTLIVAVLVTNLALIGVGVHLGIHQRHTAKGCAANGPDGLELQIQDNKTNLLLGNATDIKPGRLGKLTGAKKKKVARLSDKPILVVQKLNKDSGASPHKPLDPGTSAGRDLQPILTSRLQYRSQEDERL
jgi:hypothetical protein